MTPPRVAARGMGVGGRFRGASGTPPPTVCPGMGGSGSLPLIRPCGATFPRGERQGLLLAAAQASAGRRGRHPLRFAREWAAAGGRGEVGAPRPTDGDMETLWGLRGHPFPGRRAVGAGHARPGGLRRQASMVRSVGRGLDPSAGGYPGDGCWRKASRGVGDAAPYGLPGNGRQGGACPSSGPAGPPSPEGEGKGCMAAAQGFAGRRGRRPLRFAGNGRRREPAPHPALRGHLPPRGKARAVVGGSASIPLPRQLVLGAELEGQAVVPAV